MKLKLLIAAIRFKLTGKVQVIVIDNQTHISIGSKYPLDKYWHWGWRVSRSQYQPFGQYTMIYHQEPTPTILSMKTDRKAVKEFLSKF